MSTVFSIIMDKYAAYMDAHVFSAKLVTGAIATDPRPSYYTPAEWWNVNRFYEFVYYEEIKRELMGIHIWVSV